MKKFNLFFVISICSIILFSCNKDEIVLNKTEEDIELSLPSGIEEIEKEFSLKNSKSYTCDFVEGYVKHYYEFDSNENPNRYGWCGQTCLKSVAKYHGSFKTLNEIHLACYYNAASYRAHRCGTTYKYCANVWDLEQAAKKVNGYGYGYNFPNTSRETVNSLSIFYQRCKDGVTYNKPVIVPSDWYYTVGHYFIITGYLEVYNTNGSIDYDASYFYLRDVAISTPKYSKYDKKVHVDVFYEQMDGNQILFVRPN